MIKIPSYRKKKINKVAEDSLAGSHSDLAQAKEGQLSLPWPGAARFEPPPATTGGQPSLLKSRT